MNHSMDYVQDCFLVFDKVGDSRIDKRQVGDLVRALGLNPTNKDIDRVTRSAAAERMTFDEFVPVYQSLEKVLVYIMNRFFLPLHWDIKTKLSELGREEFP